MSNQVFGGGTSDPRISREISSYGLAKTKPQDFGHIEELSEISSLTETVETLVNTTGELRSEFNIRTNRYNAQIFDLGDQSYLLLHPILITIEVYFTYDSYIASFPELEVFGEGSTESESMANLKLAILDLYDELHGLSVDELGNLPKTWLRILNNLITKSDE